MTPYSNHSFVDLTYSSPLRHPLLSSRFTRKEFCLDSKSTIDVEFATRTLQHHRGHNHEPQIPQHVHHLHRPRIHPLRLPLLKLSRRGFADNNGGFAHQETGGCGSVKEAGGVAEGLGAEGVEAGGGGRGGGRRVKWGCGGEEGELRMKTWWGKHNDEF
ncbi:hypothetical protein Droror1_Dr00005157 [Drosera rotundifolia]